MTSEEFKAIFPDAEVFRLKLPKGGWEAFVSLYDGVSVVVTAHNNETYLVGVWVRYRSSSAAVLEPQNENFVFVDSTLQMIGVVQDYINRFKKGDT